MSSNTYRGVHSRNRTPRAPRQEGAPADPAGVRNVTAARDAAPDRRHSVIPMGMIQCTHLGMSMRQPLNARSR
jgi:hypothetical protein